MSIFGTVADLYDAARPGYPTQLFDALGMPAGRTVIDIGAGTAIATQELLARGAKVVAVDVSPETLVRARARNRRLITIIESSCEGIHRQQRDADWGQELIDSGLFELRPVAAEP